MNLLHNVDADQRCRETEQPCSNSEQGCSYVGSRQCRWTGELEEDTTPGFTNELNSDNRSTGSADTAVEAGAADDA